jgi:single stranded DNA-binding protein
MSVDVWDKQAEICGKVLKKGSNVIVDGRLCCDSYENKDGQKVNKIFITADRVNFVPRFAQSSSESKPASPEQAKAKAKTESAPKQKAQKVTVPEEGEESSNDEGGDDIPF